MPDLMTVHMRPAGGTNFNAAELARLIDREMEESAKDSEIIFASHALHATGRMARNIKSDRVGPGRIDVTVEARDPISGFDYVRITRFGHRTDRIVPKRILADTTFEQEAVVLATGRRRGSGRRAALRFVIGGSVLYRRSTRGFHPATDWAENAMPQVRARVQQRLDAFGRIIEVHWSDEQKSVA